MTERFSWLASVKTSIITAAMTMLTGFGVILDFMPAKAPAFAGLVLSIVLIYVNVRKGRIEYAKAQLEIEHMKQRREEEKRRASARLFADKVNGQNGGGNVAPAKAKPQDC